MKLSAVTEKFGSLGAIVSAMGCASCFPALGSLGAAIGLGALAPFEGMFINTLLPIFAVVALLSVLASWLSHRKTLRTVLGLAGPLMVLATLYLFWFQEWSTYMFYFALALMLAVSLWDLFSPPARVCSTAEKDVISK